MKRAYLAIAILFVLLINRCQMTSGGAHTYQATIVEHCRQIVAQEDSLMAAISQNQQAVIERHYEKMTAHIITAIDCVSALGYYESDSSLQQSALDLLVTYQTIAQPDYLEIIRLTRIPDHAYTLMDDTIIKEVSQRINRALQAKLDSLVAVQERFAKNHGLKFD